MTYWDVAGMVNSDNVTPQRKFTEDGEKITLEIYNSNNVLVDNVTGITDSNGQITYDYSKLSVGNYTYISYHSEDTYYTYRNTNGTFSVNKYNITVNNNKTSKTVKNRNITINATITDYQNETITLPDNTKLVFIILRISFFN